MVFLLWLTEEIMASKKSNLHVPVSVGWVKLSVWWQASRPSFFIATLVPLILGFTAVVKYTGARPWGLFALILFGSFAVHLATNLANDLFDYMQGVDDGVGIGGSRVIQEGKITPLALVAAIAILYILALAVAVVIVHLSGVKSLWALIVFAAFSSFFYVAPPVKYGHRALGELMVFLNMGLIMTSGTFLALSGGPWDKRILALALPVSFMVASILYFQSLPEIEIDLKAGKYTLANTLGKTRAAFLQTLWWPLIWLLLLMLWLTGMIAWPAVLCLLTVPLHWMIVRRIKAAGDGDWVELDCSGHLIRKLYLANGLILIGALALN
jgi:1,4-dihydroxy-2-naphthoate octaprenyltransferase